MKEREEGKEGKIQGERKKGRYRRGMKELKIIMMCKARKKRC